MATPHAVITYQSESGKYGFSVWMPGKRPHYEMVDVFETIEAARQWIDPQNERVWDEPLPPTERVVAVSRGYKDGSVPARLLAS